MAQQNEARRFRCLGCYQALSDDRRHDGYHSSCSKKLFGTAEPPIVDFAFSDLADLARTAVSQHLGITGVQPKIAVELERVKNDPTHRMKIVGLWGRFILKPPTSVFPHMPVVEDTTMHMAEAVGLATAGHGLIRLKSGEFAYLTRRFDRKKNGSKIPVEDFCQLSGLLTERKYKTSMEKAGKIILKYSANPGLDAVTFFDLTIFSFLTGNADMHLKNFSLLQNETGEYMLAPAYDLLATQLMPIDDREEMALTVNGKRAKLSKEDFVVFGLSLEIAPKSIEKSFERLLHAIPEMKTIIGVSFLPEQLKVRYRDLLDTRAQILG